MTFRHLVLMIFAIGFAVASTQADAQSRGRYWDQQSQGWRDYDGARAAWVSGYRGVPAGFERRTVMYRTNEAPGTIVIDPRSKHLYFILGNSQAIRYGVGVGRDGFGWKGTVTVGRKAEWPGWTPPKAMIERERRNGRILPAHMKGGIDNPLGARALYLFRGGNDTLYRIHGTNEPWTIGSNVSSGCFRMVNDDVVDLYNRARVGAKVVVL